MRLRQAEFDAAAAQLWGADTPKRVIAAHLAVDPSVLSLYRHGKRMPHSAFIRRVLDAFSALPDFAGLDGYFEYEAQP